MRIHRGIIKPEVVVFFLSLILFLYFQAHGISAGDSGDLVTAAATGGVAHPPGYPLYSFTGWLLSRFPLATVSWRVALLSSIPHAATVMLVFMLVYRLGRNYIAATVSAIAIVGNYVFFLYSVTPEVFALFDFFVILLAYLATRWHEEQRPSLLLAGSFVFGLSLTHHHVILFLTPALLYILWKTKIPIVRCFAAFCIGLLPYLYVPIAARGNSIVNWDRAVNLENFVRLVTRAGYGTFTASTVIGQLPLQRFLQFKAYGELLLADFTIIGVIFILIGSITLYFKKPRLFYFFGIAISFLGPLFFFYASFPLVNRFTLGTLERFLLPSYTLLYVLLGVGVAHILTLVNKIGKRFIISNIRRLIVPGLSFVIALYPLSTLAITMWRFDGLRYDSTAQNLAIDVLTPLPTNSILILNRDTTLFTTQYVRYVLGFRPDIMALHAGRMDDADYYATLSNIFPNLNTAIKDTNSTVYLSSFVKANRDTYPIFANAKFPVENSWYWVPFGLVYRLLPEDQLPSIEENQKTNDAIWSTFHNPLDGILLRYNHLMLSDITNVYAGSRLELGQTYLKANKIHEAKVQFEEAIKLQSDDQTDDSYLYLGISEMLQDRCQEALRAFSYVGDDGIMPGRFDVKLYEAITYRDCVGDEDRASQLFDEYEKQKKEFEQPL